MRFEKHHFLIKGCWLPLKRGTMSWSQNDTQKAKTTVASTLTSFKQMTNFKRITKITGLLSKLLSSSSSDCQLCSSKRPVKSLQFNQNDADLVLTKSRKQDHSGRSVDRLFFFFFKLCFFTHSSIANSSLWQTRFEEALEQTFKYRLNSFQCHADKLPL